MKHTKSMIYAQTQYTNDLFLTAVNDDDLYSTIEYIIKSLARKYHKGIFVKDRAVDSFYQVACISARQYNRDFGYMPTVQERFTVACDMVDYYLDDIQACAKKLA